MNRIYTFIAVLLLVLMSQSVFAQDILDVPNQGIGALNTFIDNDTLPDGTRNANRSYRLTRGQIYLIDGKLEYDFALRLIASEGAGARPILIPATDEGSATRLFELAGPGHFKSLFLTGIDDLGGLAQKNMFWLEGENDTYIIDDCFLDCDAQAFIRMESDNMKLFVNNCIIRNSTNLTDPWDGLFLACHGTVQHVISVENSTFFLGTNRPYQAFDGIHKNVKFNFCTFARFGGVTDGNFDTGHAINLTFTNNLVMDIGFEGEDNPDAPVEIVPIDLLPNETYGTDAQRVITIKNNVYGWTQAVRDWVASKPDRELFVFQDSLTKAIIDSFPNMVSENNIEEDNVFADAPDIQPCIDYAEGRYVNPASEVLVDIRADRNGRGPATDVATLGLAADEFNFNYSLTSAAATHAEGGRHVGDPRWIPTAVDFSDAPVARDFDLRQNYPNPFNPETNISFTLKKRGNVKLTVYNMLGQQVKVLLDADQPAGLNSVKWNGLDENGSKVASGIYYYQLETEFFKATNKMMLMK